MISQNDIEYYRARAALELERAKTSSQANVAEIHLELARQYEALADQSDLRPKLGLRWGNMPHG